MFCCFRVFESFSLFCFDDEMSEEKKCFVVSRSSKFENGDRLVEILPGVHVDRDGVGCAGADPTAHKRTERS